MADIDYIIMLRESLEKKIDILRVLQVRNREQTQILQDPNSAPEDLEKNMEYKAELIDKIVMLDKGFEQLFGRVKGILDENKELYAEEIKKMQMLIKQVSDLTADVQALEYKNKEYAKTRFATVRKEAREVKKSSDVVSSYYKNMMSPIVTADPAFVDRKK